MKNEILRWMRFIFQKMCEIVDQLPGAGKPIADDDLIIHILGGFGSDFDIFVVNLTNQPMMQLL